MNYLFTCCIFIIACYSNAQVMYLSIIEEENHGYDCSIFKNDSLVGEGKSHTIFSIKKGDKITIKPYWYRDTTFQITENVAPNDTLFKMIQLKQKAKQIDEVVVLSKKHQVIYEESNEFVLDYYPLPKEQLIVLSKIKTKQYLTLLQDGNKKDSIQVDHSNSIFLDPLGNYFLVGNKEVKQFNVVSNQLIFVDTVTIDVFNKKIKNIVALGKDYALIENFSMHNQQYGLFSVQNGKSNKIYNFFEKDKYERASYYYNETVNYYMATTPNESNVILNGNWDGDLMSLEIHLNTELEQQGVSTIGQLLSMINWSKRVTSKKLNIYSYGMMEEIIILNGENNTVVHIEYDGLITENPSLTQLTGNYYFDYYYDVIYMIENQNGIESVYKLDVNSGEKKLISELSEIRLPKKVKVINGQIYFLVVDTNGFNRLLKVKL